MSLSRLVVVLVLSAVVDLLVLLGSMQLVVSQLTPGSPLFLPVFVPVCAGIAWGQPRPVRLVAGQPDRTQLGGRAVDLRGA